jgi:hypothetical protein
LQNKCDPPKVNNLRISGGKVNKLNAKDAQGHKKRRN